MDKVISFSIYGNTPMYTTGLLKNLQLSKDIYPDWKVYIYYNNTVPKNFIEQYRQFDNCKLFDMSDFPGPGVLWRFLPKENVERFVSRDADSRLLIREKMAVDEWIESAKSLHIMRDHPHHGLPIYAGLFGLVVTPDLNLREDILNFVNSYYNPHLFNKFSDTHFLNKYVYNRFINDMISHNSCYYNPEFPNSKPFPIRIDKSDFKFVGEIYNEDDSRNIQYRVGVKEYGYE
jgi:hypothetical protein